MVRNTDVMLILTIKLSLTTIEILYKCTACDFRKDSKACVGELQNDGIPVWNKSYYERIKIPFDNTKCKNYILVFSPCLLRHMQSTFLFWEF